MLKVAAEPFGYDESNACRAGRPLLQWAPMNPARSFASDNNAGVHPEVLRALAEANVGHVVGYGDDPYTRSLERAFRKEFSAGAVVFPVFNGTGANVLSLKALAKPHRLFIDGALPGIKRLELTRLVVQQPHRGGEAELKRAPGDGSDILGIPHPGADH